MKRTIIFGVLAALTGLCMSAQGAERLIGHNWVTGNMSYMSFPSDFDPIDSGWAMSALGNWNVMDQLDVRGELTYAWADDGGLEVKTTSLGADAIYFFQPNQKIVPFVRGGLDMVMSKVDFGVGSNDENNLGYGAGGGAEFIMGDKAVMHLQGEYLTIDSDSSVNMDARMAYAFSPKLLGDVAVNYDFDSEITTFSLGVVYRLSGTRGR